MPKITEMFAFVVPDKDESDEGILGIPDEKGNWMPLVGADMNRVKSLKPFADLIAKASKKKYRILHFTLKGEIKVP